MAHKFRNLTPSEREALLAAQLAALDQVVRWLCPRPPTPEELAALRAERPSVRRELGNGAGDRTSA